MLNKPYLYLLFKIINSYTFIESKIIYKTRNIAKIDIKN